MYVFIYYECRTVVHIYTVSEKKTVPVLFFE